MLRIRKSFSLRLNMSAICSLPYCVMHRVWQHVFLHTSLKATQGEYLIYLLEI